MDQEAGHPGYVDNRGSSSALGGGAAVLSGSEIRRRLLAILRLFGMGKRRSVPEAGRGEGGGGGGVGGSGTRRMSGGIRRRLRRLSPVSKGKAPMSPVQDDVVIMDDAPPVGVTEIRLDLRTPSPPLVLEDVPSHLDETRLAATADPQAISPFFMRLPIEIRLHIYRAVLSGPSSEDSNDVGIHVFPSKRGSFSSGGSSSPTGTSASGTRLGHSICVAAVSADEFDPTRVADNDFAEGGSSTASSSQQSVAAGGIGGAWRTKTPCCRHARCEALARSRQMLGRGGALDNEEGTAGGLLSLMMSCKRLYFEVLPTLYSDPTFIFTDFSHLFAFRRVLPRHHLARLRHIEVAVHDHDCVFESVSYNSAAGRVHGQVPPAPPQQPPQPHLEQPPTPDADENDDDDAHPHGSHVEGDDAIVGGGVPELPAGTPLLPVSPPPTPPLQQDHQQHQQLLPFQQVLPPAEEPDAATDALLRAARRAVLSRHWDALAELGADEPSFASGVLARTPAPRTPRTPRTPAAGAGGASSQLASFRVSLFAGTVAQYGRGDERVALEPLAGLPFQFRRPPPPPSRPRLSGGSGSGGGGFFGGLGLLDVLGFGHAGPVLEEQDGGTRVVVDLPAMHEYANHAVSTARIDDDGRAWGAKKIYPFLVRRRGVAAAEGGASASR